jgi:MFS family permease
VLATILSQEFGDRGIDKQYFGYIIGSYALSFLICPPIIGNLIQTFGRSRLLYIGIILLGFTMFCFSFLPHIQDNTSLIMTACFLRLLQGTADGLINTASLAIVSACFLEKRTKYIGIFEAAAGFGYTLGPVLGTFMYAQVGFKVTHLLMAAAFLVFLPLVIWSMPQKVDIDDRDVGESADSESAEMQQKPEPIQYLAILADKQILLI